jgi:RecJ-like exonuclease
VTNRKAIKREDLVGERNRKEGKNAINITYIRGIINKVNFMPRKYYERGEDWLVTCPVCHGTGTTGKGISRKRCPKCDGVGKLRR